MECVLKVVRTDFQPSCAWGFDHKQPSFTPSRLLCVVEHKCTPPYMFLLFLFLDPPVSSQRVSSPVLGCIIYQPCLTNNFGTRICIFQPKAPFEHVIILMSFISSKSIKNNACFHAGQLDPFVLCSHRYHCYSLVIVNGANTYLQNV